MVLTFQNVYQLDLECQHLAGHESVEIDKLVKHDIDPVGCDFFNKGRNFTNTLSKLESAFVAELEAEAESLREGADKLPEEETYTRVEKLRARVKILNRCCDNNAEGKKNVLSGQELLVAAVTKPGPFSMALTAAAADDLVVLADYLIANTKFDRAMEMLQRAMEVSAALEPAGTAHVALIFHQQGRVLLILGKFLEALECMQQALDLRIQLYGHEHLDVAQTQGKIAKVFYKQGRYDQALEGYKTALETQIKVGGHQHWDVAQTQGKIAKVFYKQCKYDQSLQGYKAALETHIKFGGQEHWNVALTQGKMAKAFYKQGNYDQALESYQKTLEIQIKFGGHEHLDVAETHGKIAKIYSKQGKYDLAIQAYEASLETQIMLYGHEHPDAAKNQMYLATLYQLSKEHDKVLDLQTKMKLSADFPTVDQTPENLPASWTKERKSKQTAGSKCMPQPGAPVGL